MAAWRQKTLEVGVESKTFAPADYSASRRLLPWAPKLELFKITVLFIAFSREFQKANRPELQQNS
jgi:hypothetical protein